MPPAYRDSPPRRQAGEPRPPSAIGGRCRRASRHGAAARACAPRGRSRARRRAPWSASSARRTRSRCSSGASRPLAGVSSATRRLRAARRRDRPPPRRRRGSVNPRGSARHLDRARASALQRDSTSDGLGKGVRSPRCPAAVRGDEPGRNHCPSGREGTGRGRSPSQKTCPAEASRGSFRGEGAGWVPRAASAAGARLSASSSAAGREAPKTSHRPASLLVLALAATVARARAAEERREEPLGEVVVTAPPARESVPARDPPAFATVVDTTSAPTRVETLAEALADTVGVQVRRFGGLGDFSTVSIRGSSAGQVQVYLDGVPLGRAQNETVNLADLPLDAVDHVEVYRGTTPLAFAQSGPGGIVNVVTRRPGDTPVTGASVSYGSFETRKVDLARSARAGDFDYLAFAHYLGSQGDFTFLNDLGTTANPADDRVERRRNNAFDLGDLTARLGWRPEGGPGASAPCASSATSIST